MSSVDLIFFLFSIFLVLSGVMVIISVHPVFSLLFLVSSFLFAAFLLILMECEFLGLLFIIVYVGAIAVLFLFAVMMLESKQNNLAKNLIKYLPLGTVFGLFFFSQLFYKVTSYFKVVPYLDCFYFNKYQNWYDLIDSLNEVEVFGQVLYSYFVFQVLIAGLILFLVLISVVHLTKNFKMEDGAINQLIFRQVSRVSNISIL